MKVKKFRIGILVSAILFSSIGALLYINQLGTPDSKGLLFVTIGIDQRQLTNESSSYEIQRATEHFSDLVLGWTSEPSFSNELDERLKFHVDFSGLRQEKQNLIFYLSAKPELYSEKINQEFLSLLKSRIYEYSSATNSGYLIAISKYSDLESTRSDLRIFLGIVFLTTFIAVIFLILREYAIKNWGRSSTLT